MSSCSGNHRSSSAREDDHLKQVAKSPPSSSGKQIADTSATSGRMTEFMLNMHRRIQVEELERRLLLEDFNSNSIASQRETEQQQQQPQQQQQQQQQQQPQSPSGPCLSCLMQALQSSGLLSSCWSAAFTELEEAFAIKRVADAMTGEDGGGVAGASECSKRSDVQTVFRQQNRQPGHQFEMEGLPLQAATFQHQQQQLLLPVMSQAVMTGPGLTKWHALESLCSFMSDIGACQHRAAGGGGY